MLLGDTAKRMLCRSESKFTQFLYSEVGAIEAWEGGHALVPESRRIVGLHLKGSVKIIVCLTRFFLRLLDQTHEVQRLCCGLFSIACQTFADGLRCGDVPFTQMR